MTSVMRMLSAVTAKFFALGLLGAAILLPARGACAQSLPSGYRNHGLVGTGAIAADQRDKFNETSFSASGLAIDPKSWSKAGDGYQGVFYMLPDRGWNTGGTIDYRPRVHKISIVLKPAKSGTPNGGSVAVKVLDTILLTDAAGEPLTGLDAIGVRPGANGFPDLPEASNKRVSLDPESIALAADGGFFIGDEYGPYVYKFSAEGRMLAAIRPPEAFIPKRKTVQNFYSKKPKPDFGRQNNQGFEGLSLTPDGKMLAVILQSALTQDLDATDKKALDASRRHTRMLLYDASKFASYGAAEFRDLKPAEEYVVALPKISDGHKIAAQSELLALGGRQFFLLCRDSDKGFGMDEPKSAFRNIMLLDLTKATNIAGKAYDQTTPVAPKGKLISTVTPARLAPFIDINDNKQLNKFGLQNGEDKKLIDLSEKWESMALAPALDDAHPNDYFVFVGNDNDFRTKNGFQAGTRYEDNSGVNVDTRFLVYRITLPKPAQ
jgi:hypothetical protein